MGILRMNLTTMGEASTAQRAAEQQTRKPLEDTTVSLGRARPRSAFREVRLLLSLASRRRSGRAQDDHPVALRDRRKPRGVLPGPATQRIVSASEFMRGDTCTPRTSWFHDSGMSAEFISLVGTARGGRNALSPATPRSVSE
jgi:hypothetical protein